MHDICVIGDEALDGLLYKFITTTTTIATNTTTVTTTATTTTTSTTTATTTLTTATVTATTNTLTADTATTTSTTTTAAIIVFATIDVSRVEVIIISRGVTEIRQINERLCSGALMAGGRGASGAINKPVNTSRATNRRGGGKQVKGELMTT